MDTLKHGGIPPQPLLCSDTPDTWPLSFFVGRELWSLGEWVCLASPIHFLKHSSLPHVFPGLPSLCLRQLCVSFKCQQYHPSWDDHSLTHIRSLSLLGFPCPWKCFPTVCQSWVSLTSHKNTGCRELSSSSQGAEHHLGQTPRRRDSRPDSATYWLPVTKASDCRVLTRSRQGLAQRYP